MSARFLLLVLFTLPLAARAVEAGPRLVVVISVDQLRADYMERFRPHFGEGGFKRLLDGGTQFTDTHHRHAFTLTAPGHATILTGVFPNRHGVIANDWLNRETWESVNSVEDVDSPLVGIAPGELGPSAAARPLKTGRSPRHLEARTIGDLLKDRYGADCRVIGISNKDRSAILLGGKRADAAYWDEVGKMISSRHYQPKLPAWVEAFNAERLVHACFGRTWDRLLEPAVYERVQGPDDTPGEGGRGLGRTFPKVIDGGRKSIGPDFFTAFDVAPFTTEILADFAQRAIHEEQLGRHRGTDLLGLSFSQVDAVGHAFGPDSHEMMDAVLRLDRVLAKFFDFLDREVGLARCLIVLTADHGVAPLPERSTVAGAARVGGGELDKAVRAALDAAFGKLPGNEVWITRSGTTYHLRPQALAAKNLAAGPVANALRDALRRHAAIAAAFTREEVLAAPAEGDSLPAQVRRAYHAGRSGDVVFVLQPYRLLLGSTGSSHGGPYPYDTHVAHLWFGAGVPKAVRPERTGVDDIAPTLAARLGLPALPGWQGRTLF
jgi:hypothetical protein